MDVFSIAGQSNAMGYAVGNNQNYIGTHSALTYTKAYLYSALTDPIDGGAVTDAVLNNGNGAGSVWPLVANAYDAARARSSVWVPSAKTGSAITSWQPGADHFDRTTLFGAMLYRAKLTNSRVVLWWQGETDAINAMSQADYKANLKVIADTIYAELGIKLMVAKLQNCTGINAGQLATIQAAQADAWATEANVLAGPDLSDINTDDGYHLQTTPKLQLAATRWYAAIATAFGW